MNPSRPLYDVLVIGGSVAGLSAALLLGRCRRRVLVCDAGEPRNRFSRAMHGFLSRDGIPPAEFLRVSREQLAAYPGVQLHAGRGDHIERTPEGFALRTTAAETFHGRYVLLATGIADELPPLPGIESFYGRSVHHCPYCDGWEHRDQAIAVWGRGPATFELAEEMRLWSDDVLYCADGTHLTTEEETRLRARGVAVENRPISALVGTDDRLQIIRFRDGGAVARDALFFTAPQRPQSDLARQLGCDYADGGCLRVGDEVTTNVPAVFAAGNATSGLQLAIVAAAEGARAAHAINCALIGRAERGEL